MCVVTNDGPPDDDVVERKRERENERDVRHGNFLHSSCPQVLSLTVSKFILNRK